MQICKSKKAVLASVLLMLSGLSFSIFAQSLDMPEMPEMPSMPTIGGGFYTPSFPTRVKNNTQNQNTTENGKEKNELNATKTDSENFKKREPSILRFKINGYNIADSLTKVFFSDTEPDGSFLLTGDRRYFVNQQVRTETFYMLFKTIGSNGSTLTYRVQPTLVQDHKNENSYVYKLSGVKNLTAEKTGNLVVIHYSGDSVNADLLLDIDSN